MAELKKRYRIQAAQADGSIVNIFAKVQVFAVYTKKRSNNYMDTDDYCALVDEWEGGTAPYSEKDDYDWIVPILDEHFTSEDWAVF